MRRAAAALATVLLVACQPADTPPAQPGVASARGLGAAPQRVPQSLEELLARTRPAAIEWQRDPALAEVAVTLDDQGRWIDARAVYLAGDADRLLMVQTTSEGVSQQRPTLSTLAAQPVPADALEELPPLPDGAEPQRLAAAAAEVLRQCGAGPVAHVLYATGAPVSWDGAAWSPPPRWAATLTDDAGTGATVHPQTGEPLPEPCVTAP